MMLSYCLSIAQRNRRRLAPLPESKGENRRVLWDEAPSPQISLDGPYPVIYNESMFRSTLNKKKRTSAGPIIAEIRRRGMRLTPQRVAIIEILDGNDTHPTAEKLFRAVKKYFPGTTPATVYNTVSALAEIGALRPMTFGDGIRRFDPNTTPHHHFICDRCGKIEDVIEPIGGDKLTRLRTKRGYRLTEARITYYGTCSVCLESKRSAVKRHS